LLYPVFSPSHQDSLSLFFLREHQDSFLGKLSLILWQATVEGLQQGYCVIPSEKRFLVLHAFLKKKQSKKIVVFFSSCSSVKFHAELLNFLEIECSDIHGKQKQQERTTTFFNFRKAEKGILLCTNVAARGLDIPKVVRT
jgi:ATP-dependent RNA helicase DDX18/HAS1